MMKAPANARLRIQRAEEQALLRDPKFRRFIWRLLAKSGYFAVSHRANPADTSLQEGRRALGIDVLTDLRAAEPGALLAILGEFPSGLPGYGDGEPEPQQGADDERND